MIFAAFFLVGIFALYYVWKILVSVWNKLYGLGIEHTFSSSRLFDTVLYSILVGIVIARAIWMFNNCAVFTNTPWAILPYYHSEDGLMWFTFFPWRFLNIMEGIELEWASITAGVSSFFLIFWGTIRKVISLKVEKKGLKRDLIIQSIFAGLILLVYFGGLTAFIYYN